MTPEFVADVAGRAHREGLSEETVRRLRGAFPGVSLTYCGDDDVQGVRPVLKLPGLNVYLVDRSEHCVRLTEDHDAATGLVLAEVSDDDEEA
ncbi:hypothetical protein [Aquisphaera insulae]|uniref:hypothetical protein n=1 Tax=Aquisphaera insulae TaxID=2712864 RepID=UPI0013ECB84A|nr:hypothetical protein [Aquisphaera insulae]